MCEPRSPSWGLLALLGDVGLFALGAAFAFGAYLMANALGVSP